MLSQSSCQVDRYVLGTRQVTHLPKPEPWPAGGWGASASEKPSSGESSLVSSGKAVRMHPLVSKVQDWRAGGSCGSFPVEDQKKKIEVGFFF